MRRLAFALALLLLGCGQRMSERRRPPEGVLRWGFRNEVGSLDPAEIGDEPSANLLRQVFEGLVTLDPRGGVAPLLAQSWSVSADGRTYTFALAPGARFSDGAPLTAADVKRSFERALDPATNAPVAPDYLGDIAGAPAVKAGRTKRLSGVEALDPRTLRIRLVRPRRSFLARLTYPACAVSRPVAGGWIGSGPFAIASADPKQRIVLRRNERYWGTRPALREIWLEIVTDDNTRLRMFGERALDLTTVLSRDVASVRADPELSPRLVLTPLAKLNYLQLNPRAMPALRDPRVRLALTKAIDRKRLVDEVLGGIYLLADGLRPPGVPGAGPNGVPSYDPAAARKLLAQAGYPGGRGFPPVPIARNDSGRADPVVDAVATDWRRNLGIQAFERGYGQAALQEANLRDALPVFFTGWSGDYADPDNYASMLLASTSGSNRSAYRNPQVDALLTRADAEANPRSRLALYARAEQIALGEAALIPLYFPQEAELVSARVRGLRFTPFGHLSLASASVANP